jgi:hypothetical protein
MEIPHAFSHRQHSGYRPGLGCVLVTRL